MKQKYFKLSVHPDQYVAPDADGKKVVTMAPWKHIFLKIGKTSIIGRNLWRASDPNWASEVVYYNTERTPLKSIYTRIIVHHTNNGDHITEVEASQRARGYACLGYHYFIRKQGDVYEGRPLAILGGNAGAGTKSGPEHDPDWGSIGIALQGDYDGLWSDTIRQKQLDKLKEFIGHLKTEYGLNILLMHREVTGRKGDKTVCHGSEMAPKIEAMRTELRMATK